MSELVTLQPDFTRVTNADAQSRTKRNGNGPIGSRTGCYKSQKLFEARHKHASLVPIIDLLRAADFDMPSEYHVESTSISTMNFQAPLNSGITGVAHTPPDSEPSDSEKYSLDAGDSSFFTPFYEGIRNDQARLPTQQYSSNQSFTKMKAADAKRTYFESLCVSVKGHETPSTVLVNKLDTVCGLGRGIQGSAQSAGPF